MEDKVLIFGHKNPDTDSICSSIVLANLESKMGTNAEAVRLGEINKETEYALKYFGIEKPRLIESVEENQQVILVDHNEFGQSVNKIENAKIMKVLDHHRIADFETSEPIFYYAKPVGCTATILYEIATSNEMEIDKKMAGLMMSAIISDTLLFKSPTCTILDEKAARQLAKIADIDIEEYGLNMLKAGTDLENYTPEQLINLDAKSLSKDEIKYVIAQVNTVSIEDVLKRENDLKLAINNEINEKGLDLFVFAITDILNSNSEIIALGKKADVIKLAFGKELENDKALLEGVVSRKKQLLPNIEKNI